MGKGKKVCLILAVILLLLSCVPLYLWLRLRQGFQEQTAAERWKGSNEARFSQVSCFMDKSVGLSPEQEYSIRESLETALAGKSEERWILALSGSDTVSVARDTGQLTARVIYSAGDFSFFHPMQMVSGVWYDPDGVNRDGAVVDMQLAWKMFGGYDLQGVTVTVNGIPVQIAGVARGAETGIEQEASGQTPTIWLPMDLMDRIGVEPKVTCVEAVLPNPVAQFAVERLNAAVGVSGSDCDLVENTNRFGLQNSLQIFLHPDSRVMRTSRVTYPFWENAARAAESRCGIYAAALLLLLVFPAAVLLYWVVCALRLLRKKGGELVKKRK